MGATEVTGYTPDQLAEIEEGRKSGIDTSRYENPKYLAIQMREIRLGLEGGLDVDFMCDPDMDWLQMQEIRKGLQEGVDVSKYAFPDLRHNVMRQIRHGLREGVDVTPYIDYPAAVIEQIRRGLQSGLDLSSYIEVGFDADQLAEIRIALENDIPIIKYLRLEFRAPSLGEIRLGLQEGLDVTPFAKACYNWRQMREIRLGLKSRVDISKYDHFFYGFRQMREIRLGLEAGLPVDEYRQMRFSATDMKLKRLALAERMKTVSKTDSTDFETITELAEADMEQQPGLSYHIVISPDNMEVYVVFDSRDEKVTEDEILRAIWDAGVRKGVLRKEITKAVDGTYKENTILVAVGQSPRTGRDGYYEFFFRTDVNHKPKLLADGSVDYANVEWYDYVKKDTQIALYHPAEAGTEGMDVFGNVLPGKHGQEQRLISGKGYWIGQDKRSYYASFDGMVSLEDGEMTVSRILEVGEVSLATGNVTFDGDVHVTGNVGFGAVIMAGGDVEVEGFVEGASIISKGSVTLHKGMNGGGKGRIRAEVNVLAKFVEGVEVWAGNNIQVSYSMNSNLHAENLVTVTHLSGAVVGGEVEGVRGISVQSVGNRSGTATLLRTGLNPPLLEKSKDLFKRLKDVREELRILGNAKVELEGRIPASARAENPIYAKMQDAIYTKHREEQKYHDELEFVKTEMADLERAKVRIDGTVYPGVKVQIGQKTWSSTDTLLSKFTLQKSLDQNEERIVIVTND